MNLAIQVERRSNRDRRIDQRRRLRDRRFVGTLPELPVQQPKQARQTSDRRKTDRRKNTRRRLRDIKQL